MVRFPHILKGLVLFIERQAWECWVKDSSGFNYSCVFFNVNFSSSLALQIISSVSGLISISVPYASSCNLKVLKCFFYSLLDFYATCLIHDNTAIPKVQPELTNIIDLFSLPDHIPWFLPLSFCNIYLFW